MNHLRPASIRNITGSIALVAITALALTACSGGDKPTSKTSAETTTPSTLPSASPGGLKDESAAVLSWAPPPAVAKTKGRLAAGQSQADTPTVPAEAEIISVKASDESTVLTWRLRSTKDIPVPGNTLTTQSTRFWPDAVRLVDPLGKKSYTVNTMHVPPSTYCACSDFPLEVGPDPVQMTSAYPALPATTTTISVRIPNFAPVTVSVTR